MSQEPNSLGEVETVDQNYSTPPDDIEPGETVDQTPEADLDVEFVDDDGGVE